MLTAKVLQALGLAKAGGVLDGRFELTGKRLALSFEADATVGVRLTQITGTDVDGNTFTLVNAPERLSGAMPGLWQIEGTHEDDPERKYEVDARSATAFAAQRATGLGGEPALVFTWAGVRIPEADEDDMLGVAASVVLGADDRLSRWRAVVVRERGKSASLDRVSLPILYIRGPVAARSFEDDVVAQRYARLLIPTVLPGATPFFSGNENFWFWLLTKSEREYVHPGTQQLLQMSVLYAGDPQDARSFGWMLYTGSEDTSAGYYKVFRHGALVSDDDEPFYAWRHKYYPSFDDWTENDEPTEFGNTFRPTYPAVVGMLRAEADTYWYDALAFYRDFVETSGMAPPRIEENPLLTSTLSRHGYWLAFDPSGGAVEPPEVFSRCLDMAVAWQKAIDNPWLSNQPGFLHLQTYQKGLTIGWPATPVLEHVSPGVIDMVREATGMGFRVSPYMGTLEAVEIGSGWDKMVPPEAFWYDREHEVHRGIVDLRDQLFLDAAAPANWDLTQNKIIPAYCRELGFSSLYFDHYSGLGPYLGYDPPEPFVPQHVAHGGDYWSRGMASGLLAARSGVREFTPFGRDDPETFVFSEGPQEGLTGILDGTQDGYWMIPGQLLLATDAFAGVSYDDVPDQTRDMSIPYWTLVYHEWTPIGRMTMNMTNAGLATHGDFHPVEGHPGLTATEQVDLFSYVWHSNLVFGLRVFLVYGFGIDAPLFELDDGGQLVVDESQDPQRTGLTLAEVLNDLYSAQLRSFAGQFVTFGRMLRPLVVDYRKDVDTATNPVHACRRTNPDYWWTTFPVLQPPSSVDVPAPWTEPYEVPVVLHTVWKSPEGKLGIVLTNWSGKPARFRGRFEPRLHGLGQDDTYEIYELSLGGEPSWIGVFAGPIDLVTEDEVIVLGDDAMLGPMEPRSVRVFEVRAARP